MGTSQKKYSFLSLAFFAVLFAFSACTAKKADNSQVLRVLTWTTYLTDGALARFSKDTGIKVKIDYFSSNEELLAKLQATVKAGEAGYDLILPSDYMVKTLVAEKLIQPIDRTKLKYLVDFEPTFIAPTYDKELKYVVPFAWGTTGIGIHGKSLPGVDLSKGISWKDVFENPKFKGKVALLDDSKEVVQAVLLMNGKNLANATAADVEAVFAYLKKNKAQIKLWTPDPKVALENGECGICHMYSGDALTTMAEAKPEEKIQYLIPSEGATIWTDNFAMPSNAQNVEGAYKFLNAMQSAESAAEFTKETRFPTPNLAAKKFLPAELASDPLIYPNAEYFKKLYFVEDREELLTLIDKLWTELRAE